MDIHSLSLDRRLRWAAVRGADARGEQVAELLGEAYERVAAAAQPFFDWARGRVPKSARTPHDSTLVALEIDALTRSLRLAYVAERGGAAGLPSAMSPSLSWCSGDYDAHHSLLREAARTAVRELRPRVAEPADLTPETRWEYCYQHGSDGWELGRAPPPLARYLTGQALPLRPGSRALVLGCGRGHEALVLARAAQAIGAKVVAIDIAPTAVRLTNQAAAAAGLDQWLTAHETDLFAADGREPLTSGAYELILEHTCYCAIEPSRRGQYVATLNRLLQPGGRFIGLFYCHDYPGGPPYGGSTEEVRGRLLQSFTIEHEEVPLDSVLTRAGVEWLACARRSA